MTSTSPDNDPEVTTQASRHTKPSRRPGSSSRTALPLWVAAISLVVIAVTLIVGFVVLAHTLTTALASVQQLQQQVTQLQQGLGGVFGR